MAAPEWPAQKHRRTTQPPAPAATMPDDLLNSEVLPRLPVKSLVRFKSVCRAWRDAIESPALARRHLDLSSSLSSLASSSSERPPPTTTLLVVPRDDYHLDNLAKSPDISFHRLLLGQTPGTADVELVFEKAWPGGVTHNVAATHCDGLVAVAAATGEVFVCNPATREFVALPPGTRSAREPDSAAVGPPPAAAVAYDASRGAYVVARYFYREYAVSADDAEDGTGWLEFDIGHEVLTLGGGGGGDDDSRWEWEATDDPPHPIAAAAPVCAGGAVYWCTENLRPNALLRFDLGARAFSGVVPCPPGTDFDRAVDHVTELGGGLCYVHAAFADDDGATEPVFDVWVAGAEDGAGPVVPAWSLRCRVAVYCDLGCEGFLPVGAAANGDMLLALDHKSLYGYDEDREHLYEVVDVEKELLYERADGSTYDAELLHNHFLPYVESVVSIGGPRRATAS